MDLGDFHAPVFLTPAIIGLFADTEMEGSRNDRFAFGDQDLFLSEKADNLFLL